MIENIAEKLDDERTIAALFLVFSTYAYVESYSFSEVGGMWPRWISLLAILGCVLILFEQQLPSAVRAIVQEDYQVIERNDELDEKAKDAEENESVQFDVRDAIVTTLGVVAFGVLILAVGFMYATVVFMVGFALYFRLPVNVAIVLTLVAVGAIYLIGQGLNMSIFEGLLLVMPPAVIG